MRVTLSCDSEPLNPNAPNHVRYASEDAMTFDNDPLRAVVVPYSAPDVSEATVPCEPCQDGEHSECNNPEATAMEWDTGAHYVTQCCCVSEQDEDWEDPRDREATW